MNKSTPKFYHGIIVFFIAFAYLIFLSPYVNMLGMFGIIISQLIFAAIAVIAALILKADLKETFPMKLPSIRNFFGAVFMYIGVYLLTLSVSMIMMILFPSMMETVEGLSTLTELMPNPVMAVIVIALMPAVCEELLMRGFILKSFSEFKEIMAIIVIGIMFGIMHFDPFRFVPTAILGMASAYIVLKTKSLVLPMLYHLVNNTLSVIALYQVNAIEQTELTMEFTNGVYIGLAIVFLAVTVVCGYIGLSLINKKREKQINTLVIVCIAIALFITGSIIYVNSLDLSNISNIDISEYFH